MTRDHDCRFLSSTNTHLPRRLHSASTHVPAAALRCKSQHCLVNHNMQAYTFTPVSSSTAQFCHNSQSAYVSSSCNNTQPQPHSLPSAQLCLAHSASSIAAQRCTAAASTLHTQQQHTLRHVLANIHSSMIKIFTGPTLCDPPVWYRLHITTPTTL